MSHALMTSGYFIGLDLGQKRDWTAMTVLRRAPEMRSRPFGDTQFRYDLVHADRWRGRPYRDVIDSMQPTLNRLQRAWSDEYYDVTGRGAIEDAPITLVVDATGVGVPVVESIRQSLPCIAITIHGGDSVSRDVDDIRVPKRHLVGTLQILLENRLLGIAKHMPLSSVLTAELENFRATIKLNGHDTYGAGEDWRDGNHDDLVLSLALAAWYAEDESRYAMGSETLANYLVRQ